MTWRIDLTHTTRYRYSSPVAQSYNEARLEPRSDRHQVVLSSRIEVDPGAPIGRHVDYWGSVVHHFDVQVPHRELTVTGRAVVETGADPAGPGDASWSDLESFEIRDQFEELLVETPAVGWDAELREVSAQLRERSATPAAAAEAAIEWVNDRLEYHRGATGVQTTATEVLGHGSGVCQDFAHVALALLRAMGIPAWYVSGYLHPASEAEIGEPMVGESHAWVAAFTGNLWPLDPTSLDRVAERHVRVAAGRDYQDVAPFRGIYSGLADQTLEVSVQSVRTA